MAIITLKDITLAGIGLLSSKSKKEKSEIEKMADKSEESNKGRTISFIQDLIEKGKEQKEELKMKIKEETEKIVSEVGFVTKADFKKIEDKINEVEELISI